MPLYYSIIPGAIQTTNATPLTANDCLFVKPGVRTAWIRGVLMTGRAAGLTTLSGITGRLEKWFTTASSAGTGVTPSPVDVGMQAAKQTSAWAVATVTSGTGGPTLMASFGCGVSSQGGWLNPGGLNLDSAYALEGAATQSIDLFCASGTASLSFECQVDTAE